MPDIIKLKRNTNIIGVDVGNTNVQFFFLQGEKLSKTLSLTSKTLNKQIIRRTIAKFPCEKIIVCSVVPKITKLFKDLKKSKLSGKIYLVGHDINVPVKCSYDKRGVGIDRLVTAFAAKNLYPFSRLIIDFGTAITFDFLSLRGDYLGGLILPGIGSSLGALSSCALLPNKILLKRATKLIPKNTEQSISKGIEEGFAAMINGLTKKYKQHLKLLPKEIPLITGGDTSFILPKLNFPYIYDPFLVLKGLAILAKTKS